MGLICIAYVVPAPLLFRHMNKEPLRQYPWAPQMAMRGVLWFMSTREQVFAGYEVLYAPEDNVSINIPASQCLFVGYVRGLFPNMTNAAQVVRLAGSALELWAGSNTAENAIDLYHRMIYHGVQPSDRFAHFVIYGLGQDPTAWYWGRDMQGRGVYDVGPAVPSRL